MRSILTPATGWQPKETGRRHRLENRKGSKGRMIYYHGDDTIGGRAAVVAT